MLLVLIRSTSGSLLVLNCKVTVHISHCKTEANCALWITLKEWYQESVLSLLFSDLAVWAELYYIILQVISARKGEFETGFERGGQTREHAMLVKTAGVRKLVVVINKMDDPTVQWSEVRWVLNPYYVELHYTIFTFATVSKQSKPTIRISHWTYFSCFTDFAVFMFTSFSGAINAKSWNLHSSLS